MGKLQILANRGHNLTFVDEANCTRPSPKPRRGRVIKLMDRERATRTQGNHLFYLIWYSSMGYIEIVLITSNKFFETTIVKSTLIINQWKNLQSS